MKISKIASFIVLTLALVAGTSCEDSKSYAELLNDENRATNAFLADHVVVPQVPEDTVFVTVAEVGEKMAPYYQLDEDGNVFMQVVNAGTPGNRAENDQLIYFRFMRYNLFGYSDGELGTPTGNDGDLTGGTASFRFDNFNATISYQWGVGVQMPLRMLPIDCEVNLLIKSQYGLTSETANVQPYLYKIRYFKAQV